MTTILWADDQIDIAKSFATVFSAMNIEIVFVGDGAEALEKVKSKKYDLILADLAMPPDRWGGLWLLDQLKKHGEDIPVIVVSGEGSQSETIQALRLGAADYVTKEDLSTELPKRVSAALQWNVKRGRELRMLMDDGENDRLEFKSTLRFNLKAERNDSVIELAALKTIAGFLNAAGGTLLVGVEDAGKVVGIELDRFANIDKFQLHFWNLVRECIGSEFSQFLATSVHKFDEGTVFSVACTPSNRPVFLKWKAPGESKHEDLFFVRAGPQTEALSMRQTMTYVQDHFGPLGSRNV